MGATLVGGIRERGRRFARRVFEGMKGDVHGEGRLAP
jgi:hypothetical protein